MDGAHKEREFGMLFTIAVYEELVECIPAVFCLNLNFTSSNIMC